MKEIDTNIVANLTPLEQKIFSIIDDVRRKRSPSTVVRVAGGWTRDKILGKPSDDIDLMVDNISGSEFANFVMQELGLEKGPHVIQENPEKTKNIEAAKMYIPIDGNTVELDFVQSRTEEYGDNRREVTTKPASAQEDAMRRDLTINAIFYNINDKMVEDFTGKGIKDLLTGTIRTPYDSGDISSVEDVKKTFIEDPLRVFRVIRFAAKYNGNISEATMEALQSPEVINAIFFSERKIATERIGQEFKKMLKGSNPQMAINLLKETGLMQHIINESLRGTQYENNMEQLDMEQNNPNHEMTVWGHTSQVLKNLLEHFPESDEEKRVVMILAALTHDMGKLYREVHGESASHPGKTSYHGHEKESEIIAENILRFLKFENNIVKQVSSLARYHMQPHSLERGESAMGAMRKFIRRMGEQSINWIDVLNLSVADAYSKGVDINPETIQSYQSLRSQLEQALATMQIDKDKVVPVLNGHQIMQSLNVKPGAHMSVVQDYLKEITDQNPNITADESMARLQEIRNQADILMKSDQAPTKIEDYIVKVIQGEVKTASGSGKYISSCVCPKHLFDAKYDKIQICLTKKKFREAMSVLKDIVKQYPEDDNVSRITIISLFNILKNDSSLRDNDLLQFALDKAEHNFFDPVLKSYATGLLILLKTGTDPKDILAFGEDVIKINSGLLLSVLDSLPEKTCHNDIRNKLKDTIKCKLSE